MAILVLAENDSTGVKPATLNAVAAAKEIGGDIHVLVAGNGADEAAKIDGVAKVLSTDDAIYANRLAEPLAALIVSISGAYDYIVAPATTSGKNVLPRVDLPTASLLQIGVGEKFAEHGQQSGRLTDVHVDEAVQQACQVDRVALRARRQ